MNQFDYSMNEFPCKPGGPTARSVEHGRGAGCKEKGGLSTAHIPPICKIPEKPASIKVWQGASLVSVSHQKFEIPQKGGGPRGTISLFSRQSKKRLMNLLGTIERTEKPLFVTLTYPGAFVADSATWKNDLERFYKRLARKFPGSSFIWKLEPQKRGAPHFHLMVWGVGYLPLLRWISRAWYQVVGSGDEKHLHAGTSVEEVRSWRGVMSYASKYMGKIFDSPMMSELGWDNPGRFWGVKGRENLPAVVADEIQGLTDRQVFEFFRFMRRYAGIKGRKYQSLTISCENPTQWLRLLTL